MPEFTDDQIETAIADAIRDGDFEAVPGLLKLLALQNPAHAQQIYDAIVHRQITITIPLEEATTS